MNRDPQDLRVGLGGVRWRDGLEAVRAAYPAARPLAGIEGLAPGVAIPHFLALGASTFDASVTFDADGVVEIALSPGTSPSISTAIDALARMLGFGPITDDLEQSFRVAEIAITLVLEVSDVLVTIYRPGTGPRRDPALDVAPPVFAIADLVECPDGGAGRVVAIDGDRVMVELDGVRKVFIARYLRSGR